MIASNGKRKGSVIGIELEGLWVDDRVTKLRVVADRPLQSIRRRVRRSWRLPEVAEAPDGFPASETDSSFEIGPFDPNFAGGSARFHVRTSDSVGHAAIEVEISSVSLGPSRRSESANFVIPIEAAAVDEFVKTVRTMDSTEASKSWLAAAV